MRHKYHTRAFVLTRAPLGEANALVVLLTEEVGLVRARAQGLRKPGAKLASALATFAESDLTLVRGAGGWRVAGALLQENWFSHLGSTARDRAARISGLLLRLLPGEATDPRTFSLVQETFNAFSKEPELLHDGIECRTVLSLLSLLGLDDGRIPDLVEMDQERSPVIARINRGIALSGL